ncbi:phosphatidylserine/phosphatidylglycerophosphate/cardiolipin synthase family protein [Flavobacterium sp. ZE23DGlu08]|uniref:phospholipase D-like domain-containing protein n=1 Tax=Flavobacterium sp. ZE23DGlu08 TaxID=3059026 RepID=UPI00265F141D|nr:phospholipase D-like domain-containing protein [Flavobacterium sp. ZE23DGlu08]WKL43438.1 phospholipase D-like domain-containing protein [Flavobacterium sp. ZE23DGlu08]
MIESKNSLIAPKNLELVYSGEDYFSRLEAIIRNSQIEIHMQMYLFENDTTGNRIIKALKEAASRKVQVYVLLDGLGSLSFPSEILKEMRQSGINIRFFAPLFSTYTFYLGRRLHRKVIVADAKVVLIGGINVADKYCGSDTEAPWLDYAVQLKGEIAEPLQKLCTDIYFKKRHLHNSKIKSSFLVQEDAMVRILQNDWLKGKNEICDGYIKSIRNAKKDIIIVGSYFLPGIRIIRALKKASKNKVKIKLILSGKSDLPLTRRATCFLYDKLLTYNIELYEWDQSILHGKVAVIDGNWTTIGSFNLNNLSSYGSLEMNVEINSSLFSKMFQAHLIKIIAQCQSITPDSLKIKNNLLTKSINFLSYCITRIIEIIVTYTPYKRFNN